jgi:hypothetical protein
VRFAGDGDIAARGHSWQSIRQNSQAVLKESVEKGNEEVRRQGLQVWPTGSYISQAKMSSCFLSMIYERPLRRIDNVALKRRALFTVE